jgi:hypothetical protein
MIPGSIKTLWNKSNNEFVGDKKKLKYLRLFHHSGRLAFLKSSQKAVSSKFTIFLVWALFCFPESTETL